MAGAVESTSAAIRCAVNCDETTFALGEPVATMCDLAFNGRKTDRRRSKLPRVTFCIVFDGSKKKGFCPAVSIGIHLSRKIHSVGFGDGWIHQIPRKSQRGDGPSLAQLRNILI